MTPDNSAGRANAEALRSKLTAEQYRVTQENGTEPPFQNAFYAHDEAGIYVDVVGGEPLFTSLDKFASHSGWPAFSRAATDSAVSVRDDHSHGMRRQEVRSQRADSHLGHVFDDGPAPTHRRFCINSAALRFVPLAQMAEQGYDALLFDFAPSMQWQVATFAAGCFWGVQELFAQQPGVIATQVGYTGGQRPQVSYQAVCSGTTGHAEAVQVLFDPHKTSYRALLAFFFRMHDPTTLNQQANDRGTQYRSAIFVANDAERVAAEAVIAQVNASKRYQNRVVTQVEPAQFFVRAEAEHQHYLHKHPHGYRCHVVQPFSFAAAAEPNDPSPTKVP